MRVLLVDQSPIFRRGLRLVLEQEGGIEVIGEAGTARVAIEMLSDLRPDVVTIAVNLPDGEGVATTRALLDRAPSVRVLAITVYSDQAHVRAMFEAGCQGYLLKHTTPEELVRAVRVVASGKRYVGGDLTSPFVELMLSGQRTSGDLTNREREVLTLLAEGRTSKEIAQCLNLAVCTVETHRRQIMAKLDLHSVAQLTTFALRVGLTATE